LIDWLFFVWLKDIGSLPKNWVKKSFKVSIRPFPIVGIATHEAAAHQYPYLYGLAAV